MVDAIRNFVHGADSMFAGMYLAMFGERNAVMSFLFHSLFQNEREIARNVVHPMDRTTVDKFRRLIEYYVHHGYQFISPQDLLKGLDPRGKYVMLTFDDGYYNNRLAVPILEEFNVPAVFFISTNNVRDNKCFWWDVLYRERKAQGISERQIYDEGVDLKSLPTEQIEERLIEKFGRNALTPRCDIDRPFTPDELREFASSPCVHIGNHTSNHAILTNYSAEGVRRQIQAAQDYLGELLGQKPISIAYPNGRQNDMVVEICRELGLKVGFTVRPEKLSLRSLRKPKNLLKVGRFVPHANSTMEMQCRTYRSDILIYGALRSAYIKMLRREVA
jgi:peptidoglycan/xylan/chitin deacetylase (PgdA/CDA1 family)